MSANASSGAPGALLPTFSLELGHAIQNRLVTIGKFDGKLPSLAVVDTPDHIVIHSPHQRDESKQHEKRELAINRKITALSSGLLGPLKGGNSDATELILVGTGTSLVAYNVETNSDIFFRDMPDGVGCLCVGRVGTDPDKLALVGGNCSVQGYDRAGKEVLWTVASDNVTALAVRAGQSTQMIVGTSDFAIKVMERQEVKMEAVEVDVISQLVDLRPGASFGFGLANGTIGVYDGHSRAWSKKSKHELISLCSYDLDRDGVPELVSAWANGSFEVRHEGTGDVVFEDSMSSSMAAVLVADYRNDNNQQLICCASNGNIKGFLPFEDRTKAEHAVTAQQEALREAQETRQDLLDQLNRFEHNTKQLKGGNLSAGVVPPDTTLHCELVPDMMGSSLLLKLKTSNDTVIKAAILFGDNLFESESFVAHPSRPSPDLTISLTPKKNQRSTVRIQAIVGHMSSAQDHVFEVEKPLPMFAAYCHSKSAIMAAVMQPQTGAGRVTFKQPERVNRVKLWLQNNFTITPEQAATCVSGDTLAAVFTSVRGGGDQGLTVIVQGGNTEIRSENMDLAGDLVQSLCAYLNISSLESTADFPNEMKMLEDVLARVEQHNKLRLGLSVGMAEQANLLKSQVIRAEDARLLCDMTSMKKMYRQLANINDGLVGEYIKRANNHQELMTALKEVNKMIQKASKLRKGPPAQAVVQACRAAIKANHVQALVQIIRVGKG